MDRLEFMPFFDKLSNATWEVINADIESIKVNMQKEVLLKEKAELEALTPEVIADKIAEIDTQLNLVI